MFLARIEEEMRTCFDDDPEAQRIHALSQVPRIPLPIGRHRVEVVVVEREGDAVVAGRGDQGQGIVEPVPRGPVGVVGITQVHRRSSGLMCPSRKAT